VLFPRSQTENQGTEAEGDEPANMPRFLLATAWEKADQACKELEPIVTWVSESRPPELEPDYRDVGAAFDSLREARAILENAWGERGRCA